MRSRGPCYPGLTRPRKRQSSIAPYRVRSGATRARCGYSTPSEGDKAAEPALQPALSGLELAAQLGEELEHPLGVLPRLPLLLRHGAALRPSNGLGIPSLQRFLVTAPWGRPIRRATSSSGAVPSRA